MRDKKRTPFKLPKEPVDKYEIRWWTVEPLDIPTVIPHRAIYHINSTWKEIVGDDKNRRDRPCAASAIPGVDFVDNWQLFRRDRFIGRNVGWSIDDWNWSDRDHLSVESASAKATD